MRMTLSNTILCLLIVLFGIAFSSSSAIDHDDYAAANVDWNDFDNYYPSHLLNARATQSRFWKRGQLRKFWKRSAVPSAMENMADQVEQQDKH